MEDSSNEKIKHEKQRRNIMYVLKVISGNASMTVCFR